MAQQSIRVGVVEDDDVVGDQIGSAQRGAAGISLVVIDTAVRDFGHASGLIIAEGDAEPLGVAGIARAISAVDDMDVGGERMRCGAGDVEVLDAINGQVGGGLVLNIAVDGEIFKIVPRPTSRPARTSSRWTSRRRRSRRGVIVLFSPAPDDLEIGGNVVGVAGGIGRGGQNADGRDRVGARPEIEDDALRSVLREKIGEDGIELRFGVRVVGVLRRSGAGDSIRADRPRRWRWPRWERRPWPCCRRQESDR